MTRRRFHRRIYQSILRRQRLICACGCGERLARGNIQFDHEIPLSNGGADTEGNLRALRAVPCHRDKTIGEAKGRGKVRRIRGQAGLLFAKRNKRNQAIDRMRRREAMP